ncbi:oxidoreductase molybdopterin binding [Rippkaea orientalis PCC 8801]|uniref:Oxidoreductase molybdopterin binding n=1 Tax=Rippkaea orientalis (strain PCC 8801 / RF-1) TaxID=41431 RepID=B7JZ11_RIPO1|nr:sulfite oxidase-like oxidoreductase [Rippkaea orientalis]ACK66088.1 oxidoreductase molybdopterin binding [Rippkaea orientalis PCC 8801]
MLGKFFQKPSTPNSDRVPPGQFLATGFPVLTYGDTPQINLEQWQFKVWGLATPQTFTWSDFMALPHHQFTKDFHCVTRWSKLDVQWTGIKITDFMKLIEVDSKATHVMQHCYGGYTTNLPLEDFIKEDNFFAFELSGNPLDLEHGGPMRSVIPHLYAWKSAKWINGLEFLPKDQPGFWERNGYHRRGDPWQEERYGS